MSSFLELNNYSFGLGMLIGLASGMVMKKTNFLMMHNLFSSIRTGNVSSKLVLVVRTDLGMGKGKMASQCAHAAVCCYKEALTKYPHVLKLWELVGQPKIVVQTNQGESFLSELVNDARNKGLVAIMIHDAGRTQIERGTATVVGIGPGNAALVNEVTKNFKLL